MYSFSHVLIKTIIGVSGKTQIDINDFYNPDDKIAKQKFQRLIKTLGFRKTRIVNRPFTVCDMCILGIDSVLRTSNVNSKDVDALIFVTQSPDHIVPASSYLIQDKVNLRDDVLLLDLIQGCSGWGYALFYASNLIESKICKKVLVCTGDLTFFSEVNKNSTDMGKATLGDGASVTLLEYSEETLNSHYSIKNYGDKRHIIMNESSGCRFFRQLDSEKKSVSGLKMLGPEFADFALDVMPKEIALILDAINNDFSYVIAHQSNKFLLNSVCSILNLDISKIPFLAENTGNTSSASIPLALSENLSLLSNIYKKNTIFCGIGVGLSCVTASVDLRNTLIIPPIYI